MSSEGSDGSGNHEDGSAERSPFEHNSQSEDSEDEVQEVSNDQREQEVTIELEVASKKKRKELGAKNAQPGRLKHTRSYIPRAQRHMCPGTQPPSLKCQAQLTISNHILLAAAPNLTVRSL